MKKSLSTKLHPRNFTAMSGKMAALVGYILDESWSDPALAELHITTDGFVLARTQGDVGCNEFIGSAGDLENNISHLLDVADLTQEERQLWDKLYARKVLDWRAYEEPVQRV